MSAQASSRVIGPVALAGERGPARGPRVSFEFFPPKTPEAEETLWNSIARLAPATHARTRGPPAAGGPRLYRPARA